MLEDQRLVDPNQFAVARSQLGKDKEVTFAILRKGDEQKLTVKIGERMLPERRSVRPSPAISTQRRERSASRGRINRSACRKPCADSQERMREIPGALRSMAQESRHRPRPNRRSWTTWASPTGRPVARAHLSRAMSSAKSRPGGAPQVRVESGGSVTTWNTAEARVVVKDAHGEVEVRAENGHRMVDANDASGATIFNGPVDTPEQRKALPENVRKSLEKIHAESMAGPGAHRPDGDAREKSPRADLPRPPSPREIQ